MRQSDPEWLTSKLKKMMGKRKRLYDKYKRTNRETDYTAYKLFRNKVASELRRSKNLVTDKLLSESNLKPKDSWKTLKQFIKPQQNTTIPPLNNDGTIIQDDVDKSNFLNDYLTQQTTLTRQMHLFLLFLLTAGILLALLSLLQTKFSQLSSLCLLAKQQVLIL